MSEARAERGATLRGQSWPRWFEINVMERFADDLFDSFRDDLNSSLAPGRLGYERFDGAEPPIVANQPVYATWV
jgi:hypothetical protein